MLSNQNLGSGAFWSFLLVILVAALAWSNGGLLGDAKWLDNEIAKAEAHQKEMQTTIEQEEARLALQIREAKTAAEIERVKLEAQAETISITQSMQAEIVADQQWAAFRQSMFDTINVGLMVFAFSGSIAFTAWAVSKNMIAYKMVTMTANLRHTPSPAAQLARQFERTARAKELQEKKTKKPSPIETLYTRPFWPEAEKELYEDYKNTN